MVGGQTALPTYRTNREVEIWYLTVDVQGELEDERRIHVQCQILTRSVGQQCLKDWIRIAPKLHVCYFTYGSDNK